jgi:Flp pilus assembly protein TadG
MVSRALRRFSRREDGGATVELILILPVFFLIVGLIVDSSMIFFRQSQVFRIVHDANRNLSIGRLETADEASSQILDAVGPIVPGATAISTVADGIVTTTVSLPLGEVQITGLLNAFQDTTIGVTASHVLER